MTTLAQQGLSPFSATPYLYTVRPGDNLSRIIVEHYGISPADRTSYAQAEALVLSLTPDSKHPDSIYPGQILRLAPLPSASICPAPNELPH